MHNSIGLIFSENLCLNYHLRLIHSPYEKGYWQPDSLTHKTGATVTPSPPASTSYFNPHNVWWIVKYLIINQETLSAFFCTFVPTDFTPTFLLWKVFKTISETWANQIPIAS